MTENNVVQKPGLQLWKWNSELYNTNNPPRLGNLGRHKSLKSLPINRKSEQTRSNTLWKKYKAFLLWAFLYFYLLKPIVNIHIFHSWSGPRKGKLWLVPFSGPNFAKRIAKIDRSRIHFSELLFKFFAQNNSFLMSRNILTNMFGGQV